MSRQKLGHYANCKREKSKKQNASRNWRKIMTMMTMKQRSTDLRRMAVWAMQRRRREEWEVEFCLWLGILTRLCPCSLSVWEITSWSATPPVVCWIIVLFCLGLLLSLSTLHLRSFASRSFHFFAPCFLFRLFSFPSACWCWCLLSTVFWFQIQFSFLFEHFLIFTLLPAPSFSCCTRRPEVKQRIKRSLLFSPPRTLLLLPPLLLLVDRLFLRRSLRLCASGPFSLTHSRFPLLCLPPLLLLRLLLPLPFFLHQIQPLPWLLLPSSPLLHLLPLIIRLLVCCCVCLLVRMVPAPSHGTAEESTSHPSQQQVAKTWKILGNSPEIGRQSADDWSSNADMILAAHFGSNWGSNWVKLATK